MKERAAIRLRCCAGQLLGGVAMRRVLVDHGVSFAEVALLVLLIAVVAVVAAVFLPGAEL